MANSKIAVIGVAAIIIVAAAVAVVLTQNDNSDNQGESERGGWYAWDPTVVEAKYAYISYTPSIVTQLCDFYEDVYEDLPSSDGISVSDIPDKYLMKYDSLITGESNEGITFTNYDISNDAVKTTTTMGKPGAVVAYAGSVVDTIYQLCCQQTGEVPYSGDSDKAEGMLWDIVVAGSNSATVKFEQRFGLDVPDTVTRLGEDASKMDVSLLSATCESLCNQYGSVAVVMSQSSLSSLSADMLNALRQIEENTNTTFVLLVSGSISETLSIVDLLGGILGMETEADALISQSQIDIYNVRQSVDKYLSEGGERYTVYAETSSSKAMGSTTIIQTLFDLLAWDNIATESGYYVLGDEVVVDLKPDIICFYDPSQDDRTDDEKMRVDTI